MGATHIYRLIYIHFFWFLSYFPRFIIPFIYPKCNFIDELNFSVVCLENGERKDLKLQHFQKAKQNFFICHSLFINLTKPSRKKG